MNNIEKALLNKFMEIVQKHGNGKWALDELQWLIYEKHKEEFNKLSDEDKYIVYMYIANLKRLHG